MRLLTNLLFEPKGMHNQNAAYSIKDTVMSGDGSKVYFAIQDVPAGIPLNDSNYWKLQIDLSGSKSAMDQALASFADYAKVIGMRVRGETAKASGNPVTFLPDAGSLLQPVTVLEPQQQGSGDPYPAGGGKNLLNYDAWKKVSTERGTSVFENNGVTITAAEDDAYTNVEELAIVKVTPGDTIIFSWEADSDLSGMAYIFPNNTATGMVNADNAATKYLTYSVGEGVTFIGFRLGVANAGDTIRYKNVQIEKGSVPTSFEPSSNIRPFIGYDKLNLGAAGKNLCNPDEFTQGDLSEGRYLTNSVDTNNVSGYVPVSPNTTYTRSSNCVSGSREIALYDANKIFLSRTFGETFTTPSNCYFVRLEWEPTYPLAESWFQLEIGSTPSAYEPYQGKTHTVQIGDTVYGCRFDWLTGKFAKTHTPFTDYANMAYNSSNNAGDGSIFYAVGDFVRNGATSSILANSTANPWEALSVNTMRVDDGYLIVCVPNSITTSGELAAYMEGQMIAYKLATPVEIQLAPHIISAADPEQTNTLYGDGRIEAEYVKPLHVSIEERVAAAVAAAKE